MYYIFTCLFAFRNLRERGMDDAEAYEAGVVPSWPPIPLCPSRPAGGAAAANRGHSDSHHVHLEEGEELNEKITNKTKASERKADPLVTNMLNTMNNKPFTQLLPAWTCDSIGVSVLTSFVLYEVFYVIEVEYQNGCEFGDYTDCMAENLWYKNFNCNSMHVVGACICSLIMGAMIALPVWTHLAKEKNLGNFKTWLLWSLVNAVTNSLLVFVGKGQIIPLLVILFINGLPMGAQFLSDSILSDVIDYDEFLTGKRNEATYTMFRSFLPKMAAIPASVLPLAFLPATGYLPPVNGMVVQQPLATHWYVRICFAVIPFVFAMLSYHFKTKFVMRTDAQHVKIKAGCGMHMKNLPSKCPLSGVMVTILHLTPEEEEMEGLMGHFPGVNSIRMLTKEGGENDLVALASSQLSKLRAGLVFSAIIAIYTLVAPANIGGLMDHPILSFIPVLGVVCTGVLLVGAIGCYLRKVAALQIAIHMKPGGKITKELIKKTLAHRSMIHATFQKVNAISKGKEPPMPVSPVPSKTNPTPEPSSAAAL
jgi:Na+/melibiose symporter-like transporter